jgi:ligand-binding sensor domain-containing protein/PAS domain-containing protein
VTALEMDSLGRLWIGTESGLVWYDGQSFHHPGRYDLLQNENILKFFALNRDSLLVITYNQIYLISRLKTSPITSDDFLWSKDAAMSDIVQIKNRILINDLKDSSLFLLDNHLNFLKKISLKVYPVSIASYNNFLVVGDNQSSVYIYQFQNDSLNLIKTIRLMTSDNEIYSLYVDKNIILASIVQNGIYTIQSYLTDHIKISQVQGTEGKFLFNIRKDPMNQSYFWAGSQYFGIFHFNIHKVLENEKYSKELTNLLVWDVYPDKAGRVFAGTQYGITIFRDTNIQKLFPSELGGGDFIWGIEKIDQNHVWLATSKGIIGLRKKGNSFTLYPIPYLKKLSNQSIFKIVSYKNKQFLLTSEYPYFFVVQNRSFKKIKNLKPSPKYSILDFKIDHKGRIWLASNKIIRIDLLNNKILELYYPEKKDKISYAIEELPGEHMVYGTFDGIFEVGDERVWPLLGKNDSLELNISKLFYDKNKNSLLIGTTGKGLYEYKFSSKKIAISPWDSLIAGKNIFYINQIGDSLYIFGSELGLSFFNFRKNQWYYLNTSNGLSNNEINTSSVYIWDGYLLVGTGRGLNIIPVNQITKRYQKPKIYISYVNPSPIDDRLILPFKNNFLKINFGILSFSADPLFRTVYKIDGLDDYWIPLQSSTIYLRNLPPGDYVLKTRTYWRDPIFSSDTLEFSFSVYRPFWYSIYGVFAGILVLGLIIYGYAQYRTIRLERLSNRLRKELEEEQERSMELENIFTEIFRHSSLGIIFMKPDGEIISSNGTAIALLSGEHPTTPHNIYDYSLFRSNRQVIEAIQLIKLGKIDKSTIDIHIIEPEEKNLRLYFWHLSSRKENRIGILISDLSSLIKQKSMEVQIQAYNQILATLAHYLNNTMTILGLAEENYRLNPGEKHARLADIARMAVKKVKFILDLLDNTINSQSLKFRDYVDAKNLLIDIEEEIKKFNEENST